MEYIKKIFAYLKRKKWKAIFLLGIISIVLGFKIITDKIYIYLNKGYDRQSAELIRLIDSVIGIPYSQRPQYRNDSPGITRLSKEEWFAVAPYSREPKEIIMLSEGSIVSTFLESEDIREIDLVEDPENLVKSMPSIQEAEHAEYLQLFPLFYETKLIKPSYRQLCGYFLTCRSLNISVKDYVLHHPKLLDDIIKIAERPCDYIRTMDEVKPGDDIVYFSSYGFRGKVFSSLKLTKKEITTLMKRARERLDCDNKNRFIFSSISHPSIINRKFVLITINKDGIVSNKNKDDKSLNIIVERKDID